MVSIALRSLPPEVAGSVAPATPTTVADQSLGALCLAIVTMTVMTGRPRYPRIRTIETISYAG